MRRVPEGGVFALVATDAAAQQLLDQAETLPTLRRPIILIGTPEQLPDLLARHDADIRFDFIIGRNLLSRTTDRDATFRLVDSLLRPGGNLAVAENIPRFSQRLGAFLPKPLDADAEARLNRFRAAEEAVYTRADDPLVNWDDRDLIREATAAGLTCCAATRTVFHREQTLAPTQLERWFADYPDSFAQRLRRQGLEDDDLLAVKRLLAGAVRQVTWHSTVAFLTAAHA